MFGFQAANKTGALTITDSHPALVYSERGEIVVFNNSVVDRPAVGAVNFSKTIITSSPPKIFIRFNSGRHPSCNIYLYVNGSTGNWTGFTVWAGALGGGTLPRHVLDYVICTTTTPSPQANDYGMTIYDGAGVPTYKSEDRPVRFSKFTKAWQKSGTGYFQNLVPVGVSIEFDDYIELSAMNRGNAHMALTDDSGFMYSSASIFSGGSRTLALVTQLYTEVGGGGAQEVGDTFFCIPICKFPLAEYPITG